MSKPADGPRRKWLLRGILAFAVALLAIVGLLSIGRLVVEDVFQEDYGKFNAVKIGMTEEAVRELLGEPWKVCHRETAPTNYYVEGYAFRRRQITNKVYIYVGTEPIAYVYFDKANKVEDVFVGGS